MILNNKSLHSFISYHSTCLIIDSNLSEGVDYFTLIADLAAMPTRKQIAGLIHTKARFLCELYFNPALLEYKWLTTCRRLGHGSIPVNSTDFNFDLFRYWVKFWVGRCSGRILMFIVCNIPIVFSDMGKSLGWRELCWKKVLWEKGLFIALIKQAITRFHSVIVKLDKLKTLVLLMGNYVETK